MLNCKDATHRMSEAEDRDLGLTERLELSLHLALCSPCAGAAATISSTFTCCAKRAEGIGRN